MRLEFAGGVRGYYNSLSIDPENKTAGTFSICISSVDQYREAVRTVRYDEDGKKFFTWNKKRIYIDDFLAYSPEELVEKITKDKKSALFGDSICKTLLKYGMDSLSMEIKQNPLDYFDFGGVKIGFRSSRVDEKSLVWVPYHFVKEFNRNPEDCYKLRLDPDVEGYPQEDYYIEDLISMLKCCPDKFRIKTKK